MALKRKLKRRKSIAGFKRSAEGFALKLNLKARSGLSMRSSIRNLKLAGGPSYRKKFSRKYRG